MDGAWKGMAWPASKEADHHPETGVEKSLLEKVGRASVKTPENFEIHPKLHRHVKNRLASIDNGKGIDFATAEVREAHFACHIDIVSDESA
jgi:probable 2-oxoglutarate dehydrogenase E1 component DHKTD1